MSCRLCVCVCVWVFVFLLLLVFHFGVHLCIWATGGHDTPIQPPASLWRFAYENRYVTHPFAEFLLIVCVFISMVARWWLVILQIVLYFFKNCRWKPLIWNKLKNQRESFILLFPLNYCFHHIQFLEILPKLWKAGNRR